MCGTITPHRPLNPNPQIPPFHTGIIPPTPNHPPSLPPFLVLVSKDSDPDFNRLGGEGVSLPGGEEGEFAGVRVKGVDGEAAFALARNDTLLLLVLLVLSVALLFFFFLSLFVLIMVRGIPVQGKAHVA